MTSPKLVPRLVPQPLWGISAARLLPRSRWKAIRADAMAASGGACTACGVIHEKGMVGDEVWHYGDGIATLVAVRIVCRDCDAVTHMGSTAVRGYGADALLHMSAINGMTFEQTKQIVDTHFDQWRIRSARDWTVAVAPDVLARYPELAILDQVHASKGVAQYRG